MKPINNMESLLREKKQLQAACKRSEQRLNEHLNYLQHNLPSLVLKSISPFSGDKTDKVSNVLDIVNSVVAGAIPGIGLNNPKTARILKVAQMFIAGFVYNKAKDIFSKKKTVPDENTDAI